MSVIGFKVLINNGAGDVDYTAYVQDASVKIEDAINVPTLCDFTLVNINDAFVVPVRNAYVKIFSQKESRYLFTGIITALPEIYLLGAAGNTPSTLFQRQSYKIHATSDEYLLNVKLIPFIPAFVNQTMGSILANLANTLAPGYFDTSSIQGGDLIPYFQYDPTQKWSDLAKTFADGARFRYHVISKKIYFEPFSQTSLGVSYDETKSQGTFTPYELKTSLLTVPVLNDVIVIGDIEPQNIHDDYFIGDGVTSNFPMRHAMFRGQGSLLLQEDWTGTTFGNNWTVVDPALDFALGSGALSVAMTATGALGVEYIQGQNGVELGGHLDLQHGEFFFTGICNGIVGGVYSSSPPTLANCVLGFNLTSGASVVPGISFSGASGIQIQPILNGALLPASSPVITKTNHHYFLETFVTARRWSRYDQIYRTLAGTPFGDTLLPSQAEVTFIVWDIDLASPETPVPTKYYTTASLPSFGLYVPVNAQQLNFSLNFTLINQPPQGLLTVASLYGPTGLNMPIKNVGPSEPYRLGSGFGQQVATIAASQVGTGIPGVTPSALQFYAGSLSNLNTWVGGTIPAAGARIRLRSWEAGKAIARVQDPNSILLEAAVVGDSGVRTGIFADLNPLPRTSEEAALAAQATIYDRNFAQYDGTYNVYDYFRDKSTDFPRSGRYFPVYSPTRGIGGQNFLLWSQTLSNPAWSRIQQNTPVTGVTAPDGTPTATRFTASVGAVNASVNQNAAGFTYPNKTVTFSIWLRSSVNATHNILINDGTANYTAVVQVTPTWTRFSATAKLAAGATQCNCYIGGGNLWTAGLQLEIWGGQLEQSSVLRPLVRTTNLTFTTYASNLLVRHVSHQIVSLSDEVSMSDIEFGQDLYAEKLLKRFLPTPTNIFDVKDSAVTPTPQQLGNLGTLFAPDMLDVTVLAISGNQVFLDLGATPVTGAEIRRTDSGWGVSPAGLTTIATSRYVTLNRTQYEQIWYIRQVNGAAISRVARVLRVVYPLIPSTPYAVVNIATPLRPLVSVGLTGDLRNLRFTEIRDSDNSTVLYQQTFASYNDLLFTYDNSVKLGRSFNWFVYFSNLQYEYSPAFNLQFTIPTPVSSLVVDEQSVAAVISATGIQVNRVDFIAYKDASLTMFAASGSTAVNVGVSGNNIVATFPLTVDDMVQQRYFITRATDPLGTGPWSASYSHIYTPQSLVSFDNINNVANVPLPGTPNTDPVIPVPFQPFSGDLINEGWQQHIRQVGRQYR